MAGRYPEIEPYDSGMLAVGDGNQIYWECCGNPEGTPAVVLHGGPGSGCRPSMRRYFDPASYRIVLFDQRNCRRSTPLASDPAVSLAANTTPHLLTDIERLREHLGIERWLVFGWSWGCALALAYAERHTDRVRQVVVTGAATGRQCEVDLLTRGLGRLFPADWAKFRDGAGQPDAGDLPAAYSRLLNDPDPAVRAKAARDWCDWEEAAVPTNPRPSERFADPLFRYGFARVVTHYWSNGHFLPSDGVLLAEAGRLGGVPGVIVQGTLDLVNLVGTPWELAAAWPGSELVVIDDAGHGGNAALLSAIVAATDRFARAGEGR
jgi:proline iminopeptidase